MKISELARATATPVDTIRYYERQGLLPAPARSGNNWRHYGSAHVERLTLIRQEFDAASPASFYRRLAVRSFVLLLFARSS